jgi:tetratricopeptide (TPR) repeat protein
MKLPSDVDRISLDRTFAAKTAYPPMGFYPFFEYQLGNGDTFGLYWPIGREQEEPIVAEVWHDEWRIVPGYSSLHAFLKATERLEEDDLPESPSLELDPRSPVACFEAAKLEIQAQRIEEATALLEAAVAVLPEFTDALGLLGAQYIRLGRYAEAGEVAVRAIISPPCFGGRPLKLLRWLASQREAPPSLVEDPIWLVRSQLCLTFGGVKENPDYPLLLNAIEQYDALGQILKAVTLAQTYAELMSSETVAFRERYGFQAEQFFSKQLELSARLRGGPRRLDF